MQRITLKPLDDGQKAVEIPVGKTTIGRGPFLGCSDKKVSRNHAVLEVTSKGEVYLTPTHVNPCFYQPTADSPGQILKKDIPHKLENGDSFSLLPRAFRYQLVVTGESAEDKTDQNDLNKQSGKTNGAAVECEEALLNERNKDIKTGKGIPNEELADGNTVTEKTFSKEDEILANIDKSYSKDENTFAKKIPDISDDSTPACPKEDKEINEEKEPDKEKSDANSTSKNEASSEEKKAQSSDAEKEETDKSEKVNDLAKNSESCTEAKIDEEKSKFGEKIVEEESTLGNDSFPKEKTETDHALSEDKSDTKSTPEKADKKSEDLAENNEDDNLDEEPAKELEEGEENKDRTLPDWAESEDMPPPKVGKKRGPKKGAERKAPKRKQAAAAVVDTDTPPPKPKGRKKAAQKFTFDDEGEGSSQRNTPGRTSSRTNRQTRQGLSLEDFIVSDDDEWQSDRSSPKPRRKRGKRRGGDDSGSDWEVEHKKTKKPAHKFGSGSESGSDWGSAKKKRKYSSSLIQGTAIKMCLKNVSASKSKGGPRGRRRKVKRAPSEVGSDDDLDPEPAPSEPEKKTRIACTYGKKCHRRNQNHIDQFSHPGDSDYDGSEPDAAPEADQKEEKEEEKPVKNEKNEKNDAASESAEEDESNKKECPFGANCFRKNPQHKKDFKHTKKVRPRREAAKADKKKTRSGDVDSYDLNDSLLNDDSDEYKPADSGSDYETGDKTKRFVKGKGAKNKRGRKV